MAADERQLKILTAIRNDQTREEITTNFKGSTETLKYLFKELVEMNLITESPKLTLTAYSKKMLEVMEQNPN